MKERNEHHSFKADEIPCQETSDPAVLSKNPLVSVKMITYNHELYIAQAIEGVLLQKTDFSIELIIGEDCSTDRTREIVIDYQKKYPDLIRVITWEENVGMQKNSLRTNKACRGKYIAICEGDDYWIDPLKLKKQVDFLEANADYGMVHTDGDFYYIKNGRKVSNYIKNRGINPNSVEKPFDDILRSEYPVITCSVVFRSNSLKRLDIEEISQFKMGDTFMWLEMAQTGKFHFFEENMVTRNILVESAAHSKSYEKLLEFKKSGYKLCKHFMKKYKTCEETKHIVHEKFNRVILSYAFKAKNAEEAKNAYNQMKLYNSENLKLTDRLHYFGSKNTFQRYLALFVIFKIKAWKKICKKR
jgi:glycosyltransferase involved in cell wall biosynthesis